MKSDLKGENLVGSDALLEQLEQYQHENDSLRKQLTNAFTTQANLTKSVEFLQTTNEKLRQETYALQQKVRELQILIAMPTSEVDNSTARADLFHKTLATRTIREPSYRWLLLLLPIIALTVILGVKWLTPPSVQNAIPEMGKSLQARALSITEALEKQVTEIPKTLENQPVTALPQEQLVKPVVQLDTVVKDKNAIEEGYLIINIPNDSFGTARVRNGYHARAREIARVEAGMRFRIRAISPSMVRRKVPINGVMTELDDFCYKISDKEQWIFGYFTNRRQYGKVEPEAPQ